MRIPAWILCAILATAALVVDMPLQQLLRDHPPRGDVARLLMLCEFFGFGWTVALIVLAVWVLDHRHMLDYRRWQVVPQIILYAYGAGLAANLLKCFVARTRPRCLTDFSGDVWSTFVGMSGWIDPWTSDIQSFPSGHAATAVGLAIGLGRYYPRGKWLFATYAALACMQRVVAEAHFLSDVIIGAAVAMALASLIEIFLIPRTWQRADV